MSDIKDNQDNNADFNFDEFENFLNSDEVNDIFDTTLQEDGDIDNLSDITSSINIDDAFDDKAEPFFDAPVIEEEFQDHVVDEAPVVEEEFQDQVVDEAPVIEEEFQDQVVDDAPVIEEEFQDQVVDEAPVIEEEFQDQVVDEAPVIEEEFQDQVVDDAPVIEEEFQDQVVDEAPVIEEEFQDQVDVAFENNMPAIDVVPSDNLKYLKWYSGNLSDEVYEFNKSSESANFIGSDNCKTIHVNVGYDTYGWNVQFSDGVIMSLRDVREYQIRNGRLPNSSGRIVYGQNALTFEKVDRIIVYEAVKYFSYGI